MLLMTQADIENHKSIIDQSFNVLKSEQNEKQARVDAIQEELLRLQGEYRAYDTMLPSDLPLTDPNTIAAPEPELIEDDPNKKAEKK